MLCQICGNQNYSLKITRIRDGMTEELKVCEDCAIQISPYHAKIVKKQQHKQQDVENLLKHLMAQKEAGGESEAAALVPTGDPITCQGCGLDFARYKQTFMLGCPDCYDNFGEQLMADIRRIHGAEQHVGSATTAQTRLLDLQARDKELRAELEDSVKREDFQRAAQLRDEIRQLWATAGVEHHEE